jgi:hypothetical protein
METEHVIDGWNAWFYSDLKSVPKVWPGFKKNKVGPSSNTSLAGICR